MTVQMSHMSLAFYTIGLSIQGSALYFVGTGDDLLWAITLLVGVVFVLLSITVGDS